MSESNDGARQAGLARQTLSEFTSRGEDLNDTRHVIHYFYGGDTAGLREVLERQGFAVQPTSSEPGLIAERNDVTDEAWAERAMPMMCSIADEFGAEYDGWEASLERQPAEPAPKRSWLAKILGK